MAILKSEMIKKLPTLAAKYRIDNIAKSPFFKNGFVFFTADFNPCGWCVELPEPKAELPGNYAVDVNSQVWQAVNGNSVNGAKEWVKVNF